MVNAFVTARRGTCFLSIRIARRTCDLWRIRAYTIDAVTKRDLRRLHPEVAFDWSKITRQLAVRREECRRYRSRRQSTARAAAGRPIRAVYDPATRTLYADGEPSTWQEAAALLDAVLAADGN